MLTQIKNFIRPIEHSRQFQLNSSSRPSDRAPYPKSLTIRKRSVLALIFKRALDLALVIPAVIVLSPLFLVIAAVIKWESKGPVFFKQERVGIGGKIFTMYKFRSMVVNAEDLLDSLQDANEKSGPIFKMKRDPRITKSGAFLRKHSLDELPQLLNVLKNDMSLVGPRPPLLKETLQYEDSDYQRLCVLPGLTCIWQISGRSDLSFQQWMELDRNYINNWSVFLDIKIIAATIREVVFPKGSY